MLPAVTNLASLHGHGTARFETYPSLVSVARQQFPVAMAVHSFGRGVGTDRHRRRRHDQEGIPPARLLRAAVISRYAFVLGPA